MAKAKPVFVRNEVYTETSVYTDLDSFIATLCALRTNPLAKYEVETSIETSYGSEYAQITVYEIRPENSEEKSARLKKARAEKTTQEERDLAEFDRLKKKLGK
jgi:hypothetical protein